HQLPELVETRGVIRLISQADRRPREQGKKRCPVLDVLPELFPLAQDQIEGIGHEQCHDERCDGYGGARLQAVQTKSHGATRHRDTPTLTRRGSPEGGNWISTR